MDLELEAEGIIKDLVFKKEKIIMDIYYTLPGNFNLIRYGIVHCYIVQEQIVGAEYRQVLQIIPLIVLKFLKYFQIIKICNTFQLNLILIQL